MLGNQGSRHTRILGTALKIQYFGAIWSSLKRKDLQSYQTRSHTVFLYNTLSAGCIEKAVGMKTQGGAPPKGALNSENVTSRAQITSQYGPQDPQSQETRSSWEPPSDSKSNRGTCSNTVHHRISGVPLSAVEPLNTTLENSQKVNREVREPQTWRIIHSFREDLSQTQKINELCENSSK